MVYTVPGSLYGPNMLRVARDGNELLRCVSIRKYVSRMGCFGASGLFKWLCKHLDKPYPAEAERNELGNQLTLEPDQINYWYINARARLWKPLLAVARQCLGGEIILPVVRQCLDEERTSSGVEARGVGDRGGDLD